MIAGFLIGLEICITMGLPLLALILIGKSLIKAFPKKEVE